MRPIFRRHWPVEGDESECIVKMREQRGQVAVADKNLGMRFDFLPVDGLQQIVGAIATAGANNCAYLFAYKHVFEFPGATLHRSCEVQVLFKDGIEIKRTIPRAPQGFTASLQFIALDVAGRGYDADHVAGSQRGWPDARN